MKTRKEKMDWLIEYLKSCKTGRVNMLDADFVSEYVEWSGCESKPMLIGADRCKDLGSLLSYSFQCGTTKRTPVGLRNNSWQPGLPKWVFSYELKR